MGEPERVEKKGKQYLNSFDIIILNLFNSLLLI